MFREDTLNKGSIRRIVYFLQREKIDERMEIGTIDPALFKLRGVRRLSPIAAHRGDK